MVGGVNHPSSVECQRSVVGGRKVGRTANKPRNTLADGVLHFAGGIAAAHSFFVGWQILDVRIPTFRKLPLLHLEEMVGQLRIFAAIVSELRHPGVTLAMDAL